MKPIYLIGLLSVVLVAAGCGRCVVTTHSSATGNDDSAATVGNLTMSNKVIKTEAEWKQSLTPEQYRILRQKGTERAYTGEFWNTKEAGTYRCAGCEEVLFESDTKYDSGCGWPSFYAPVTTNVIAEAEDRSHFMVRTEVLCSKCGGHLGHVFDDGPQPTGLRYCINSAALKFESKQGAKTEQKQ